jgi:hypothetical protein
VEFVKKLHPLAVTPKITPMKKSSLLLIALFAVTVNTDFFRLTDKTFHKGQILRRNVVHVNHQNFTKESALFLDSLAAFLIKHDKMQIEVGHFTDQRGSEEFNKEFSQLRVDATVNYLTKKGVNSGNLVPVAYGEANFIYSQKEIDAEPDKTKQENMYKANKRTEFKILAL